MGPFEFGTLKASVASALAACGWVARPIQPVGAREHVQGLMFRVHAVAPPPVKVMHMSHGDVVITQEDILPNQTSQEPQVVASAATVAAATKGDEVDMLQVHDPWAPQVKPAKGPLSFHIGSPLEDMEHRVVEAVLAQLPKSGMEVDEESSQQLKVASLEQQVQDLHRQTQTLGQTVQQNAVEQAQQLQEVQAQVQQQSVHFESAIQAHAKQLHGFQETFQEQFRQQTTHQQPMLDSMFQKQMSQFEHLLTKRPRQE